MNKRLTASISVFSLFLLLAPTPVNAAAKAGAKCTKAGITEMVKGKSYTCAKSGKKLFWNKGVVIKTPTSTTALDSVNYKGTMIYGVRESKIIRRADTGVFYETDSRKESDFSAIRVKAFNEVNKKLGSLNHPNIEFVYDIRPSYPPYLIEFVKRELDKTAAL